MAEVAIRNYCHVLWDSRILEDLRETVCITAEQHSESTSISSISHIIYE